MNKNIMLSLVSLIIVGCSSSTGPNSEQEGTIITESRMFCSVYDMPTCDKHAFICTQQDLYKEVDGNVLGQNSFRTEPFTSCASGKASCCDEMCAPAVKDETEGFCEKPFVNSVCDCDVNSGGCLPSNCKVVNGHVCCQF